MSMQRIYRHRGLIRLFVAYMIVAHGVQIIFPTAAYALTGGPGTPASSEGFTPLSVTNMVNPFTGSFGYNMPLMDVGGYPINLSYAAMGGMDAEASSVGFNWSLGIGSLNRSVMVTPDDFKGDLIKREIHMKPNLTVGASIAGKLELFGKKQNLEGLKKWLSKRTFPRANFGVNYNNYSGYGFDFGISPQMNSLNAALGPMTVGLDIGFGSKSGIGVSTNLSFSGKQKERERENDEVNNNFLKRSIGVGANYNSRGGLQNMNLNVTSSVQKKKKTKEGEAYTKSAKEEAYHTEYGSVKGSISFASSTHTPRVNYPFLTTNFSTDASLGHEIFGAHPGLNLAGYLSVQTLTSSKLENKAYGYAYLHEATDEFTDKVPTSLDFNREGDGPFIQKATPNLPIARPGFDIFSANGHGMSGSFRIFRDPGIVYDPYMKSQSMDASGGVETGGGQFIHVGGNVSGMGVVSGSGRWKSFGLKGSGETFLNKPGNPLREVFKFKGAAEDDPRFEPYYFKEMGELSVDEDENYYTRLGDEDPVRVSLEKNPIGHVDMDSVLVNDNKEWFKHDSYGRDEAKRAKRNQAFQMLTADEAEFAALNKKLRSYPLNDFTFDELGDLVHTTIDRTEGVRKEHHFSAGTVIRQDGMRYVYDLPSYNWKQREVSFNVSDPEGENYRTVNAQSHLVKYKVEEDNSTDNRLGIDEYFSADETPAYANTYHLTGVLSPDYVDLTGDGITDDDLGQAFQLNYTRYHDQYRWRTPVEVGEANYNTGYESRDKDDKANYTYGEKELWYIHSIISRHYIAEFTYDEARKDGFGVTGENGGAGFNDSQNRLALKKITLYAKKDRQEKGNYAVPIKTVHFEQDYSLFDEGVLPNSQEGKLTLKKVWFTYGNSQRGKFNPYRFYYADPNHDKVEDPLYNPAYSHRAYDRWGNYKPNTNLPPNWIYPFTDQNQSTADRYAQAWLLHTIQTPSGGTINIDYEAHDYAYVQDRKAMQMVKVLGFGEDQTDLGTPANDKLFEKATTGSNKYKNFNYVFVQLPQAAASDQDFKDRYLKDHKGQWMKEMFFNLRMPVNRKKDNPRLYEQVAGFVKVKNGGLLASDPSIGWLEVELRGEKDEDSDEKVHGMAREAWNFIRNNLPERVFPGSDPKQTDEAAIKALGGLFMEMKAMFKGYHVVLRDRGFADHADLDRSWVRLYHGYRDKIGGSGARVKQIYTSDQWSEMTGSNASTNTYGQRFDYTTVDERTGETISSGVAAFEPMIGSEENPFYMPDRFEKKKYLAQNDEYYVNELSAPFAYPAATVGYSKVKISNLPKDGYDIKRHGMGYVVKEFYTAKDFPVIIEKTKLDAKGNPQWLPFKKVHFFRASQGYMIKRNDMHGKPKGEQVFGEDGENAISGVAYHYRTKKPYDPNRKNELDNSGLSIITPEGEKKTGRIGHEMEFLIDERQQQTRSVGLNLEINAENIFIGPILISAPTIWPVPNFSHTQARFITTTKLISQYGLLEEVVAFNGNAEVSTKNLAYDSETGGVLLTETINEFKDPIFNFSMPAHWTYDGMEQSYQNLDMEWDNLSLNQLRTENNDANTGSFLVRGDELLLMSDNQLLVETKIGWVLEVNSSSILVVDREGAPLSNTINYDKIKILRSGHDNTATTPVMSVVSMANPLAGNQVDFGNPLDASGKIVTASAVTFADRWQMQCGTPDVEQVCDCEVLTEEGQDLQALINALIASGQFANSYVNLNQFPNEFANSSLFAAVNADPICSQRWMFNAAPTGNDCAQDVTITLEQNCYNTITTLATITLSMDPTHPYLPCMDYLTGVSDLAATTVDQANCGDDHNFLANGLIDHCGDGNPEVIAMTGHVDVFPISACDNVPNVLFACAEPSDQINPYTRGILGNWRPVKTYTHLTGRTNGGANNEPAPLMNTDIRNEGVYNSFDPFWEFNGTAWTPDEANWTYTAEATRVIPQGQEIESRDPLGRYSAAIFGYYAQVPIGVASNARNAEIAYANFEVASDIGINCQAPIKFVNAEDELVTRAHTGKQSLRIKPLLGANTPALVAEVGPSEVCDPAVTQTPINELKDCDCAGNFQPYAEKEYLLTLWVFGDQYYDVNQVMDSYDDFSLVINGGTIEYEERGQLIDGWQRIEVKFQTDPLVNGSGGITVELVNNGTNPAQNLYVDDFSIQPFLSSFMKYVYDARTLRLMATLDDNSYATFYNYDHEGQLIGTRQETVKGIQSLNETRTYLKIDQD